MVRYSRKKFWFADPVLPCERCPDLMLGWVAQSSFHVCVTREGAIEKERRVKIKKRLKYTAFVSACAGVPVASIAMYCCANSASRVICNSIAYRETPAAPRATAP